MPSISIEGYNPKYYHKLAEIMTDTRELAIFNRFDDIAALRLLSLQAEILRLQSEFQYESKKNDVSGDENEKQYSQSFRRLNIGREQGARRAVIMDKMFSKLDQYYHCVIQANTTFGPATKIQNIGAPDERQLTALKGLLQDKNGGRLFLADEEFFTWDSNDTRTYIMPTWSSTQSDPLTAWIFKILNYFYGLIGSAMRRKVIAIDVESGLFVYNSNEFTIQRVSRLITAAISSVLPVMTIYILNVLNTTEKRIGFTAAMTAFIAGYLSYFTEASRAEVLSATATFAAVEVVYIGGVLGNV